MLIRQFGEIEARRLLPTHGLVAQILEAAVDVGDVGLARRGALEEERAHQRGRCAARRAHPSSAPGVADDRATRGSRGSTDRTASDSAPCGPRDLAGISIGTRCICPHSTSFDVALGDPLADALVMGVGVEDGFGASTSERHRGDDPMQWGPAFVAWMDAKYPRAPRVIKFRYCLQRAFCSVSRALCGLGTSKIDVRLLAVDRLKLARWVAQRCAHFAYLHPPRWRLLVSKRTEVVLALSIGLLVIAIRAPLMDLPLERDEGGYAYIAWRMTLGETPYLDWFDQKPPGIFAAYRVALSLASRCSISYARCSASVRA